MSYFREGDYNVVCGRSGFKVKRSDCRKEWNGLLVDKRFWKPRHPQDLPVKSPKPSIPTDVRNFGADVYVEYPSGILLDSNGNPILDSDGLYILVG